MKDKLYEQLQQGWEKFNRGEENITEIRSEILASWKRCRAMGMDPLGGNPPLDKLAFKKVLEDNKQFIEIVTPFLDMIGQLVQYTGFMVTLVDKNGYILATHGDEAAIQRSRENLLMEGANRSEAASGTNAMSLAISERKPFQIIGPEHYRKQQHQWTCSAAPLYDPRGELMGVLNLTGHHSLMHKHTLGMVISLSHAIEREFSIIEKNSRLQLANERLKAVMDSIGEGVVAIDQNGSIIANNAAFRHLLSIQQDNLIGARVDEVLTKPGGMLELLQTGKEYFDKEENLASPQGKISGFVTARKILDDKGEIGGAVCIIRENKNVYHLVNRIIGSKAVFSFDDIVHESLEMENAIMMARAVAESNTRVILEGESGTGKELFAQAIHNADSARHGPFVAINCSAIPRELIESELFGYSEGAFTGAKKGGKPGKFELAEGGTLFLDEINSMPLDMQIKLLRVLQQNEVTRVGGEKAIPVNVRIISAANESVEELVKAGRFRLDLFYRLGVVIIKIPTLRERLQDVPLLFDHLTRKMSQYTGKGVSYSLPELSARLTSYDWPGNVRELENCIERAVILAPNGVILPEHLPESNQSMYPSLNDQKVEINASYLAQKEREAIEEVLNKLGGNISKAAKMLGVSRNTLYNKIKSYDL